MLQNLFKSKQFKQQLQADEMKIRSVFEGTEVARAVIFESEYQVNCYGLLRGIGFTNLSHSVGERLGGAKYGNDNDVWKIKYPIVGIEDVEIYGVVEEIPHEGEYLYVLRLFTWEYRFRKGGLSDAMAKVVTRINRDLEDAGYDNLGGSAMVDKTEEQPVNIYNIKEIKEKQQYKSYI